MLVNLKEEKKINKQEAIETKIEVIDNSNLAKKAKQLKPEQHIDNCIIQHTHTHSYY